MLSYPLSDTDLGNYLDEALPVELMAEIERQLRSDTQLVKRLVELNLRRDSGAHSVGAVWRRHRLTCPSRSELGAYLLETLSDEQTDYIAFHLHTVGCRVCLANLEDLQKQAEATHQPDAVHRRQKYFQSSVGHLSHRSTDPEGHSS